MLVYGDDSLAVRFKNNRVLPIIAVIVCVVAVTAFTLYDASVHTREYNRSDVVMGSVVSLRLHGPGGERYADQILERLKYIEEANPSRSLAGADIYRVNLSGEEGSIVSGNTVKWLERALKICKDSDGALDITLGRLTELWDFDSGQNLPPEPEEIESRLPFVGWEKVNLKGNTVTLSKGQALDMGALGKGIACDEAADILKKYNVKSAIISVGGSVLLFGKENVRVGIRDPKGSVSDYMGTLKLKNKFISTSGNYEKSFTFDNVLYHHLLDAKTGYPARSGLVSVTVVCDSGLDSDALSTACFVRGIEKSLPLLEKYNAQAVFITEGDKVFVTEGLSDNLKITNEAYVLTSDIKAQ